MRFQNDGSQFNGASRIAIGFVPFVGPAMDICEAVTGKEWCLPSGRTLTTGERVFSGIGFGVGKVVKVWKGISSAAISTEGKGVAAAIATLTPDLVEKLAKARIAKYKTLTRGSILADTVEELDNAWEVTSLLALIEKKNHKVLAYGKGSRDVLGIVKGASLFNTGKPSTAMQKRAISPWFVLGALHVLPACAKERSSSVAPPEPTPAVEERRPVPETMHTSGYDQDEMDAAIKRAKSEVETFIAVMKKGQGEDFSVKAPITDMGKTEHFWIVEITYHDGVFEGEIGNDPGVVGNVQLGDKWKIAKGDISDWSFKRNGKIHGNYTMRPLLKTMPKEEADMYRSMLANP